MLTRLVSPVEQLVRRGLARLDAACNQLYGWRYNPLYQSGTIAVALYIVLLVTGLWLVLFYRVGDPYGSVARLTANPWVGNWVRGLHRYASDLAVVATLVHAVRMFAQARSWGARTLAWVSGAVLLLFFFVCGWTGYVLVWDSFGEALAREGARMIDALPILSEPTSRVFTGEQPVPTVFFFINLFLHIGVPLLMGVAFWLHVKRLPRTVVLPPKPLAWGTVGALTAVAILWPLDMAPGADPFVLPASVPADVFFAFWMPLSRHLGGGAALLAAVAAGLALLVVPWVTARRGAAALPPSHVDEEICTGCTQCVSDCPYGALAMIDRTDGRPGLVARVDPSICVSCGICSGSCAPMGVGPPGRTGRDQVAGVRAFLASPARRRGEVVVVGCEHGAIAHAGTLAGTAAAHVPMSCAGNLHTSAIELLLRGGAGGVLIVACPPRDCWNREGPRWLTERVYHDREAELHARVDRSRIRIVHAGAGERRAALDAVAAFGAHVATLDAPADGAALDVDRECEIAEPPRRSASR